MICRTMGVVKLFFHDKRFTMIVLAIWSTMACTIFYQFGAFSGKFMTFGPSETTEFMAMKIDTWAKWYALATFSFCNTTINEFIGSALVPWLTNTIQDQKTRYLDHSKSTCMFISLSYDVYVHVMSIFGLYLMFSQIDFLMIRMVADCIVTMFTTWEWMKNKKVDKEKHDMEGGIVIVASEECERSELKRCEFTFSETNIEDWKTEEEEEIPFRGTLLKSSKHRRSASQRFEIPSMPTGSSTSEVIETDLESGVTISPRTI